LIQLNPKRREHINSKANEVYDLIKTFPIEKKKSSKEKGTIKEKPELDITNRVVDALVRIQMVSILGEEYDCTEEYQDKKYGFDKLCYPQLIKFVSLINSTSEINSRVSEKFVKDKSIHILFDWYRTSKFKPGLFCDLLLDYCNNAIIDHEYNFPIAHLEIDKFIKLGHCLIYFYTSEELSSKEKKYDENKLNKNGNNPYSYLRKDVLGIPLIKTEIKAESEKGYELAFEECSLTIDCIKVCCLTTNLPQYEISFDIDCRTVASDWYKYYSNPVNNQDHITIHQYRPAKPHHLDATEWQDILSMGIEKLNWFLLNRSMHNTELCDLITGSIKRYAQAISTHNLHQRIIYMFTILESLLLKDENASIIESVSKYLPKIIFTKPEDRKFAVNLLKKMYKVRSASIHHALEKKFEMEDLRKLQIMIVLLIMKLISRLKTYKSKNSILEEIDNRILNA